MDKGQQPLVSCIMPTYNRRQFVPNAIRYFLRQDYARKELIILDDGTDSIEDLVPLAKNVHYYRFDQKITLGAKLNLACTYAAGDILAHWDDDDWYADHRLSYQVAAMQQKGVKLCGINQLLYLDLRTQDAYLYAYPPNQKVWLSGSSLCYTKDLWERIRFVDTNIGMDGLFVWATPADQIKVLEDNTFSVLTIHEHNVSPKKTDSGWWHSYPVGDMQRILGKDWKYYSNGHHKIYETHDPAPKPPRIAVNSKNKQVLKNVYACLVHESQECILDLVRNLHFHDPSSVILLYNGSANPNLIPQHFPYEQYGVFVHPTPRPQKHGYLHHFALDCMAFALENLSFDTLTIVDSDQLAVRSGYTQFVSDYLSRQQQHVGMFSSRPERITANQTTQAIAMQAFKEYDLWKPFLKQFPDGENQFVHWTFWPSTVFTQSAVRDLVRLFREDQQLQTIMQQTKIWATEEVVFPTLVKLLGYEITANPCHYDYVQYRKSFTLSDANRAFEQPNIYWMHPVERQLEHPLRRHIRERFNGYSKADRSATAHHVASSTPDFQAEPVIRAIKSIEGWLSDDEARLLVSAAVKALRELPPPHWIVEVGSYHGKSTVLLGSVVKFVSPQTKVCAVDPHDGMLGAVDQGLKSYPPSLDPFKKNIRDANLTDIVDMKIGKAVEVPWMNPISFLYIDGLHDYTNVSQDFQHFSIWLQPGAYVAFHDYADYFPGVKKFVHELLETKQYKKVDLVQSMMVLQKTTN